jgi:hypothetical protein
MAANSNTLKQSYYSETDINQESITSTVTANQKQESTGLSTSSHIYQESSEFAPNYTVSNTTKIPEIPRKFSIYNNGCYFFYTNVIPTIKSIALRNYSAQSCIEYCNPSLNIITSKYVYLADGFI